MRWGRMKMWVSPEQIDQQIQEDRADFSNFPPAVKLALKMQVNILRRPNQYAPRQVEESLQKAE